MTQKEKDRLIGSIVAIIMAITGFLAVNFFGSFITRAEYIQGFEIIRVNQEFIKKDLKEIKEQLRHEKDK